MGISRDPTVPNPQEAPTVYVTVTGSPVVVTTTAKETVTATVTPSAERVTSTVTQTASATPRPQVTKTVTKTVTPKAVPNPAPVVPSAVSTVRDEWEFHTPIPSVAPPVQSMPGIVIQIPPAQPVANDSNEGIAIAVGAAVFLACISVLLFIAWRLKKGK